MAEIVKMSKAYLIYEKRQDFTVKETYTDLLQICTSRSLTRAFVEAYVTNEIEGWANYCKKYNNDPEFIWTSCPEFSDEVLFNPDGFCYITIGDNRTDSIVELYSIMIKEVEVEDG